MKAENLRATQNNMSESLFNDELPEAGREAKTITHVRVEILHVKKKYSCKCKKYTAVKILVKVSQKMIQVTVTSCYTSVLNLSRYRVDSGDSGGITQRLSPESLPTR